jgi:hypothetical protein
MSTNRWTSELDQVTRAFNDEFRILTETEIDWRPNTEQWSVAQNIHHLIVVNETYYPTLQKLRNNSYDLPWLGRIEFLTKFFGKTVLAAVQPDRRKKMRTFPLWEPGASNFGSDILMRFEKHQDELKKLIDSSQDLIEKNVVISSPANKMIVYKLETAFDIMVAHEKRHLEQAKEINQIRIKQQN